MTQKYNRSQHPHVSIQKVSGYDEYCVRYYGLKPDRSEAMAYYTDDKEDARDTAMCMEHDRHAHVFNDDIKNWTFWGERLGRKAQRVMAGDR